MIDIGKFIDEEIAKRDMTRADLCREAHIKDSSLSKAIDRNSMGPDLARSLAKGLKMDEDVFFYKVGILSRDPRAELDPEKQEVVHLYDDLEPSERSVVRDLMRTLLGRRQAEKRNR